MRRLDLNDNDGNVGFQIAPMIDVVFVIMLFFMVMAGSMKKERNFNTKLPGIALTSEPTDFVDEQIITISSDGQVSMNDEPMDGIKDTALGQLKATLVRLKAATDAAKGSLLITIVSDPQAKYRRTINVLDALAECKVNNVTFTVAEENQ